METLDFTRNEHDWWSWFMLHNKEAVESITEAEGFDPTKLEVNITVNGVTVLAKPFNNLMDALVNMAAAQEIEKRGLHSIREAAGVEAAALLKKMAGDFEERFHELLNQMHLINESSDSIIQTFYNSGFNRDAARQMTALLKRAKVVDDKKEKHQSFTATTEGRHSGPMGDAELTATGYGADEGEARKNLELAIYNLIGARPCEEENTAT